MWYGRESVYKERFDDEIGVFFDTESFPQILENPDDVSDALQGAIDTLTAEWEYGILYIPEGVYPIKKTIFIPPSVRLIGYGQKRPEFVLPANTKGYEGIIEEIEDPMAAFMAGYPGANYMFWFLGDKDTKAEEKKDANAATFYSAISNIDFRIEDGNPGAVCIRAHFAQHGFINHCYFDLGNGLAGIFDVGNEMEDLTFNGGQFAMLCRQCSPGWPFVLLDSVFEGQKESAIRSSGTGFTGFRLRISNTPKAFDILYPDRWEKMYLEDCVFENISDTAITFDMDVSPMTQINLKNIYCAKADKFIHKIMNNEDISAEGEYWHVKEYTHGYCLTEGEEASMTQSLDAEKIQALPEQLDSDVPSMPDMSEWVSVKKYGATGDGETDDTKALQEALDKEKILYFPQGIYRITDSLIVREGSSLIGMSPITTQIVISDDEEAFAGFGTPKGLLETEKGGFVMLNGIGLDTAGKNPRAAGLIWKAGEKSYCNDVKFVGGHGLMFRDGRNAYGYLYNGSRTADYDPDRIWDFQYSSLWITDGGGGVFKDVWSASPYAEAGIAITNTSTQGKMYCISLEHHVRHEIKLNKVSNWNFYGFQTEEEKAEGMDCQPIEIVDCHNLLFANLFMFRVVAVDRPYESAIRIWDSSDVVIKNAHNYAQMQYAFNQVLWNPVSGFFAKAPEYAKLVYTGTTKKTAENIKCGIWEQLCNGFNYASGAIFDAEGNLAFCDKTKKQIYRYFVKEKRLQPLYDIHFTPACMAYDTQNHLMVGVDYSALRKTIPGQPYIPPTRYRRHPFFAWFYDRSERVYAIDVDNPYDTMQEILQTSAEETNPEVVYRPAHGVYYGALIHVMKQPIETYYMAPDGKTALEGTVDLARSIALTPVREGDDIVLTEDNVHQTYLVKGMEKGNIGEEQLIAHRGEFGGYIDKNGTLWIVEDKLYGYVNGEVKYSIPVPKDAYHIMGHEDTLYLFGRDALWSTDIQSLAKSVEILYS